MVKRKNADLSYRWGDNKCIIFIEYKSTRDNIEKYVVIPQKRKQLKQ